MKASAILYIAVTWFSFMFMASCSPELDKRSDVDGKYANPEIVDAELKALSDATSGASKLTGKRAPDKVLRPKEAMFYTSLGNKRVQCDLCPHNCILKKGESGKCLARTNKDGVMFNISAGKVSLTPSSNKVHFTYLRPAKRDELLFVGGISCQLACSFCGTALFSQRDPHNIESEYISPQELISIALKNNFTRLAFSRNEPTLNYRYLLEVGKLAKPHNISIDVATSGFINYEPMKKLIPYLSTVNVGLKGFSESFYKKYTTGSLQDVLNTLLLLKKEKIPFTVIYLVIPTLNDSEDELLRFGKWVAKHLGQYVPVHLLRYGPAYKLSSLPATPLSTMQFAMKTLYRAGLKHVSPILPLSLFQNQQDLDRYKDLTSLKCPHCGKLLFEYKYISNHPQLVNHMKSNGRCQHCNNTLLVP